MIWPSYRIASYLALFIFSALLSYLITPLVKSLGQSVQAYGGNRNPGGQTPAIPRLGGLAVLGALIAAGLTAKLIYPGMEGPLKAGWPGLIQLACPVIGVLALGIFDDLAGATPFQKFGVEIIAASMLWCAGIRITVAPILGTSLRSPLLSVVVTVLWIVAASNAFNMMDGLDGLAVGIALIISSSLFVVALSGGDLFVAILAVILSGALAGFLRFNSAPAVIYLGDTGSLFLGFLLAALAVLIAQHRPFPFTATVPFLLFALPLLEISATVARRLLTGRPLFTGDQNHFHHRLLANQMTPRRAASTLYALDCFISLGSVAVFLTTKSRLLLLVFILGSGAWVLLRRIEYEEFSGLIAPLFSIRRFGARPYRIHNRDLPGLPEKVGRFEVKHETGFSEP